MGPRACSFCPSKHLIWPRLLLVFAWLFANERTEAQPGPQTVVREFCRLDAMGARATLHGWAHVGPLVQWEFEPAWDRVVLVTSYTVGWPVAAAEGAFVVEVRYAVRGFVNASGFDEAAQVESRSFRVEPGADGSWRIAGPPPPPHIFTHGVDVPAMQQSLQRGGVNFLPNSLFVWQLYQRNGWNIPFEHTLALGATQIFRATDKPQAGDLVLYLDGDTPYHVGVLETEEVVISATLNAGIVRTALDAFPGARRFLHLRPPELWPPTPTLPPSRSEIERLLSTPVPQATPTAAAPRGNATAAARKPATRKVSKPRKASRERTRQ
ncbi:MAG: hypothetical protein KatS3mg077_1315 [Candidatus Binatia bacterium]|nr:MAG: hypothetical protein KatS3mg077_1315 [Candidatus Binatia bacterium]